jgi:hypothetical protein
LTSASVTPGSWSSNSNEHCRHYVVAVIPRFEYA